MVDENVVSYAPRSTLHSHRSPDEIRGSDSGHKTAAGLHPGYKSPNSFPACGNDFDQACAPAERL
jgi:hypothetical protein